MSQSWKTVKTLLTSKSLKVQFIPTDSTCTLLTSQSFKVQFIPTPLLSAFLFPTIGSVWQSVYCACQCCDVCAMALAINCIQGRSWSLDWSNNRIGSFSSFFCLSQCHCLWFMFSVQVIVVSFNQAMAVSPAKRLSSQTHLAWLPVLLGPCWYRWTLPSACHLCGILHFIASDVISHVLRQQVTNINEFLFQLDMTLHQS